MEFCDWLEMGPPQFHTCSTMREEKSGDLNAKSVPRFACRVSGSIFSRFPTPVGARFRKYTIYIYQNAQNEALSVVLRFILSNYELHAKR